MQKILATAVALAAMSVAAQAGSNNYFVKLGGSYIAPDSNGKLGPATITAGNTFTGSLEAGGFLTDMISVSMTAGIPPTHAIIANGVDTTKTVTLGAFALDAQLHVINTNQFDVYVGGGLAYNVYFSSTNPKITGINNGFAPVLQAGAEFRVSDQWGVFVDVKKEFFTTRINYTPAAASFDERLDPLVITAGVGFHF